LTTDYRLSLFWYGILFVNANKTICMKYLFLVRRFFICAGISAAAIFFASCNNDSDKDKTSGDTTNKETVNPITPDPADEPMVTHAEATINAVYTDTTVTGKAVFDGETSGKVKMVLELTIPAKANKEVAVHIHEHGDCSDNANMAHGHWNPGNKQHGKWGTDSYHAGDIGNVKLDAKGKGTLTLETDLWTLGGVPEKNILGKALIVHGGTDDYVTQPTGNAGSRIGCGVINK
jgi:Cu-Zn family superoxide dismutase